MPQPIVDAKCGLPTLPMRKTSITSKLKADRPFWFKLRERSNSCVIQMAINFPSSLTFLTPKVSVV